MEEMNGAKVRRYDGAMVRCDGAKVRGSGPRVRSEGVTNSRGRS